MAHFAELDGDNKVLRVVAVNNAVITTEDGEEQEQLGIDFLSNLHGGTWIQTSYNSNFRKHYAGIDFTYDKTKDAFICKKPYPSWVLVEDTCGWEAPLAIPDDGKRYYWNEDTITWDLIDDGWEE